MVMEHGGRGDDGDEVMYGGDDGEEANFQVKPALKHGGGTWRCSDGVKRGGGGIGACQRQSLSDKLLKEDLRICFVSCNGNGDWLRGPFNLNRERNDVDYKLSFFFYHTTDG
mmetsp:Transcript_16367/g.40243  ORF Transcript_16367/g.40243 Transcript_16367/m.40243 type:complete len:112 (-) Transcript_16367:20-355(-)